MLGSVWGRRTFAMVIDPGGKCGGHGAGKHWTDETPSATTCFVRFASHDHPGDDQTDAAPGQVWGGVVSVESLPGAARFSGIGEAPTPRSLASPWRPRTPIYGHATGTGKMPPSGQHSPGGRGGRCEPESGGFGGGLSPSQIMLDTLPIPGQR